MVDINYNFEFDWFVELSDNNCPITSLSDNKLSDNNLARTDKGDFCLLGLSNLEFHWLIH